MIFSTVFDRGLRLRGRLALQSSTYLAWRPGCACKSLTNKRATAHSAALHGASAKFPWCESKLAAPPGAPLDIGDVEALLGVAVAALVEVQVLAGRVAGGGVARALLAHGLPVGLHEEVPVGRVEP